MVFRVVARVLLGSILVGGLGSVAACEDETAGCVLGSERCACIDRTICASGLSCFSDVCVKSTVPVVGGMEPPAAPPMMGETTPQTVTARDAGSSTPMMMAAPARPQDASVLDVGGVMPPPMPRDAGVAEVGPPTPQSAEWTVLIYGHGDHNLTPSLLRDIQEMARARLNDSVQVVVLVDWNAKTKTMGEPFPKGAFWYRIPGNGQAPKVIGESAELDFDSPSVLATAIKSAFKAFPAKRYGLILWDHGGAWRSGFGGDTQDGERRSPGMAVSSVANALRAGVEGAGLTGDRPLDFLAFDTCLMAGAEVVGPFEQLAKVYIANAELDFGDGLDYTESLSWLAANPGATTDAFARAEAQSWDVHHKNAGGLDLLFRSHVAIDTTKFSGFATAMKSLSDALSASALSAGASALYHSFPSYFTGVARGGIPLRDAGNVLENLKASPVPAVSAAAGRALEQARGARIAVAAGELRVGQLGVHLYGGPVAQLDSPTITLYSQLASAWEQQTGWGAILAKLKASAPSSLAPLTTALSAPPIPTPESQAFLDVESPGPDTAYIEGLLIRYDESVAGSNTATALGVIAQGFIKAGAARIRWGGQSTLMRVNPKNLPVNVSPWAFTAQGQVFKTPYMAVPGMVRSDEDEWVAGLLMDTATSSATHLVVSLGGGQTVVLSIAKALSLLGDKTAFYPARLGIDLQKGTTTSAIAADGIYLPGSGRINFVREPVLPGRYVMAAYVEDFWGNTQVGGQVVQIGTGAATP